MLAWSRQIAGFLAGTLAMPLAGNAQQVFSPTSLSRPQAPASAGDVRFASAAYAGAAHRDPVACVTCGADHGGLGHPTPVLQRVFGLGSYVVGTTKEYVSLAFRNADSHGRYVGLGDPLVASSWLNRPYHVGWRTGLLLGESVQSGQVTQDPALFFGYQIGADLNHYWGAEWRMAWSSPKMNNATQTQFERTGELFFTDVDAMYYPWGDSRLRPFASVGLGLTEVDFRDQAGVRHKDRLFTIPFGVGLKHHWRKWLSWRIGVHDNLGLTGGTVDTMHNVTFTLGVEVHLGVRPKSYSPWFPDRHYR